MWVCSGNHSDSNPLASASRASSAGPIDWSVGKMTTPTAMSPISASPHEVERAGRTPASSRSERRWSTTRTSSMATGSTPADRRLQRARQHLGGLAVADLHVGEVKAGAQRRRARRPGRRQRPGRRRSGPRPSRSPPSPRASTRCRRRARAAQRPRRSCSIMSAMTLAWPSGRAGMTVVDRSPAMSSRTWSVVGQGQHGQPPLAAANAAWSPSVACSHIMWPNCTAFIRNADVGQDGSHPEHPRRPLREAAAPCRSPRASRLGPRQEPAVAAGHDLVSS